MRVVSVSLPEDTVDHLDAVVEEGNYSGRSELVRAALDPFLQTVDEERGREGPATATLTLGYDEEVGDMVNRCRHEHAGPIKTMVHGHASDHTCLEVLVLEGEADAIQALAEDFRGRRGVHRAELVWLPRDRGSTHPH